MKTRGKVLLATLSAAMLVTASVMGTLAYLQDSDEVVNTFTVGKVGIELHETGEITRADGTVGLDYKLMPGHEYAKDPVITVEDGSEDSYLFVKVENQIADIEDDTTIADQMKANDWVQLEGNVYYYNGIATDNDPETPDDESKYPVFETFKVKGDVKNETLAAYAGKTIKVTAYAVQKDGFNTAAEAWAAAKDAF